MERDINVPTGWLSKEHYGYDAMNRLTSVLRDEDGETDTFSYYQDGEMSAAHYGDNSRNVTYNLDLAGNRTSLIDGGTTTYIANNLNEYTTVGNVNPQYVPAHAMSAFGTQSYYYIAGTFLARSTVGANDLYLYYDALGRCMKRKLNGVSSYRVFQGEHWIAEYTASNVNIGTAIYGNDVDELIARGYNGVPYWYFPDRNGNISVVLNTAGGVLESYRYDAFGAPSFFNATGGSITQSAIGNPFLFTGREWDHAFGLYEYRARGYDPDLGRFLSEDPKGFDAGDYNLYRYCENDPLDNTDPTGTIAEVTVDGNDITIRIPIKFSGEGITSTLTKAYASAIENAWSGTFGKYQVHAKVDTKHGIGKHDNTNKIQIVRDPKYRSNVVDCRKGTWNNSGDTNMAGHEGGHLLGQPDRYTDTKQSDGSIKSLPNNGYEKNIMGNMSALASEQDIHDIIDNRKVNEIIVIPHKTGQ
jgi:RHS repeat-associated protein